MYTYEVEVSGGGRHVVTETRPPVVCKECKAIVRQPDLQDHKKWHTANRIGL